MKFQVEIIRSKRDLRGRKKRCSYCQKVLTKDEQFITFTRPLMKGKRNMDFVTKWFFQLDCLENLMKDCLLELVKNSEILSKKKSK